MMRVWRKHRGIFDRNCRPWNPSRSGNAIQFRVQSNLDVNGGTPAKAIRCARDSVRPPRVQRPAVVAHAAVYRVIGIAVVLSIDRRRVLYHLVSESIYGRCTVERDRTRVMVFLLKFSRNFPFPSQLL